MLCQKGQEVLFLLRPTRKAESFGQYCMAVGRKFEKKENGSLLCATRQSYDISVLGIRMPKQFLPGHVSQRPVISSSKFSPNFQRNLHAVECRQVWRKALEDLTC